MNNTIEKKKSEQISEVDNKKNEIPDGWHEVRLKDVCGKITNKNTVGNDNVLTISAQQGFINQQKFYNKSVAGADLSTYYLLTKGEFGYNRSYSNGYPMGAIKRLDNYEHGVVSTLYLCFKFGNATNSDFINYYFDAGMFNKEIYKIAQEGARNHGLLNVNSGDFFNGTIVIPKQIKEQEAIADILSGADEIIEATKEKIDLLKLRKKSLMQKLLSPKSHWVEKKLGDIGTFSKGNGISKDEVLSEGLPCIRYGEIYTSYDFVINEFKSFINKESIENSRRLCENDLLFAGSGETKEEIGKCVSFNKTIEAYAGGDIIIYSPNKEKYKSYFLSYFLNTFGRRQLNKLGQGDSVVHIYKSHLENIKIPLPTTTEEQEQIAAVLSTCDEEIKLYEQKLKTLEKQKKGLMQKLLTGKWRVQLNKEAS